MARYTATKNRKPKEIVNAAKDFYGSGGVGLEIIDESDCCIRFEGGGGFVYIFTEPEAQMTRLDLEVKEWDKDTRDFLRKLDKLT